MGRRRRQVFAYLAVVATGLASLATQPCTYSLSAETPSTVVDVGAQGAEAVVGFRVLTDRQLENVELTARLVSGDGSVEAFVPDVWLGPGDSSNLPDGGLTEPIRIDATETTATVCDGVCAKAFEVQMRRTAGTQVAQLELSVKVRSATLGCDDASDDQYLVVERVP